MNENDTRKAMLLSDGEIDSVTSGYNNPNDPNSIADWFHRHGLDGSYYNRERLFREAGWDNYISTPRQNLMLLTYLKSHYGD